MFRRTLLLAAVAAFWPQFAGTAHAQFGEHAVVLSYQGYTYDRYAFANTGDNYAYAALYHAWIAQNSAQVAYELEDPSYNYYTWAYAYNSIPYAQHNYETTGELYAFLGANYCYWASVYGQASYLYDP